MELRPREIPFVRRALGAVVRRAQSWFFDRRFDRTHLLEAEGARALSSLNIGNRNAEHGVEYAPTPFLVFNTPCAVSISASTTTFL